MTRRASLEGAVRRDRGRLRTCALGAVAVLAVTLSGCGDPDDGDGDDGGSGYVAQQPAGWTTATVAR